MKTKIVDKYTLKVWSDTYNRYVEYFSYTTLERVKEQIDRCIEDYHNSYNYRRKSHHSSWDIWKGNKTIDFKTANYKIIHKRYEIKEELILEEEIEVKDESKNKEENTKTRKTPKNY